MENVSEKLYNILCTKFNGPDIKTLDAKGNETMDIEKVDMFSFDFKTHNRDYGPVVILISANNNLEIYYGDNTSRALDHEAKVKWQDFIEHMSTFARSNRLGFSLKNITDLRYDLSNIVDIKESYKKIFESYYGTSKTSYNPYGKAKIIIKHTKALGENDARYRNIESIYIENADGERFKLPFKKLTGARAMARHVTEGGNPYDLFGIHISEMVKNINTLGGFVRRSGIYEGDDDTERLVKAGKEHYEKLKKILKRLATRKGYSEFKDSWDPSEISDSDHDIDSIRHMFVDQRLNQKVEDALPILASLREIDEPKLEQPSHQMKEVDEFEEWANSIVENNNIKVPTSEKQARFFQEWLSKKRPVGIDALNVMNTIGEIIGNNELHDELLDLADRNAEADARPVILRWLKRNIHNNNIKTSPFLHDAISNIEEGIDIDLDADKESQLHSVANKDLAKYAKKKRILNKKME